MFIFLRYTYEQKGDDTLYGKKKGMFTDVCQTQNL